MDSLSLNKNRLQLKYYSGGGHLKRSTYLMRNAGLNCSLDRYHPALQAAAASRAKKHKALHSDPKQLGGSAANVALANSKPAGRQQAAPQKTEPAAEDGQRRGSAADDDKGVVRTMPYAGGSRYHSKSPPKDGRNNNIRVKPMSYASNRKRGWPTVTSVSDEAYAEAIKNIEIHNGSPSVVNLKKVKKQKSVKMRQDSKLGSSMKEQSKDYDQAEKRKKSNKSNQSKHSKHSSIDKGSPGQKTKEKKTKINKKRQYSQNKDNFNVENVQYESDDDSTVIQKPQSKKGHRKGKQIYRINSHSRNETAGIEPMSRAGSGFYGIVEDMHDQLSGSAGTGGNDIFTPYLSQQMIMVNSDIENDGEKQQRVLLSQIFHGKQALTQSKPDLLLAKRESRALRIAKNTHIKKGQFVDAFCTKAIQRTEERLIQHYIKQAVLAILSEEEPMSAQKVLTIQQSNIPFHSSKGSMNDVPPEPETAHPSQKLRLAQEGGADGSAQAHLRMESLQSLHHEYDVTILKNADQQNEENRFKQSEMKMMSAEQNSQQLRHEIDSGTELNMFVPEKVMAGYGELSDSADHSLKNAGRRSRDGQAVGNQVSRTKSAHGAAGSNLGAIRGTSEEHLGPASLTAAPSQAIGTLKAQDRESNQAQQAPFRPNVAPAQKPGTVKPQFQGQAQRPYGRVQSIRNADFGASSSYFSAVKSPPRTHGRRLGRKQGQRQQHPMLRSKNAARQQSWRPKEFTYTNADLRNIQEQIRQQVEYQKFIQAQSQNISGVADRTIDDSRGDGGGPFEKEKRSGKSPVANGMWLYDPNAGSSKELAQRGPRNVAQITSVERHAGMRPLAEGTDSMPSKRSKHNHEIRIEGASDGFRATGSPQYPTKAAPETGQNQMQILSHQTSWPKERELRVEDSQSYLRGPAKRGTTPERTAALRGVGQLQLARPTASLTNKKQRLLPQGGLQFSQSRQRFNLQGPILTQVTFTKKDVLRVRANQARKGNQRSKQYLELSNQRIKEEKSQLSKQDGTSQALSHLNINQPDFISSFDVNEHSDQQQMSILAISQANAPRAPSQKDSSISQNRTRGRSGQRSNQKSPTQFPTDAKQVSNVHLSKQKQFQPAAGTYQKAVSSYSLSSKHSGYSSMTPLREQQLIQARFINGGKPERRDGGRAPFQKPPQKRVRRKLDFDTGEGTHTAVFDAKSKPKRAWTLKQETQADRVIEEGSDDGDNSFASDTPGALRRRGQEAYEGFQQAYANPDFKSPFAKANRRDIGERKQRRTEKTDFSPNDVNAGATDELDRGSFATRQTNNDRNYMMNSLSNKQMAHLKNHSDSAYNSRMSLRNKQSPEHGRRGAEGANEEPNAEYYVDSGLPQQKESLSQLELLRSEEPPSQEPTPAKDKVRSEPRIATPGQALTPQKGAGARGAQAQGRGPGALAGLASSNASGGAEGLPNVFQGYATENARTANKHAPYGNPDNSAQKLRQTIINTRRGNKNVWMGGSTTLNTIALAPIDASVEYGHRKPTGARMRPGMAYLSSGGEPVLWSGNRASLTQQSAAILLNRTSMNQGLMNRANQHKFQQIARPYIMSNSQGGTLHKNLKNGLGQTVSYGTKTFIANAHSKYSLLSSVGGTDRDPQHLKKHPGLPDLSIIHSQTLLDAKDPSGFSPKTTAALLAADPGHKSQTTFVRANKFSPRRAVGAIYGVGGSDDSAAEQEMRSVNGQIASGADDTPQMNKGRPALQPLLPARRGENSHAAMNRMNRSFGTILASSEVTASGPVGGVDATSAATASRTMNNHRGSINQPGPQQARPKSNNTNVRRADGATASLSRSQQSKTGALPQFKMRNPPQLKSNLTLESHRRQSQRQSVRTNEETRPGATTQSLPHSGLEGHAQAALKLQNHASGSPYTQKRDKRNVGLYQGRTAQTRGHLKKQYHKKAAAKGASVGKFQTSHWYNAQI